MRSVHEIECVSGRGLAGDRYFAETGTFSATAKKPSHEVTLVEAEKIDDFNRQFGMSLRPEDLRRNLITRGIRLNDLVGQRFVIGAVTFEGIRLCEPCSHLAQLTHQDVLAGLVHQAGLRAAIIDSGTVRVGDPVDVRSVRLQADLRA
jgi:MOSC domain-containing protein YiiM